STSTRHVFRLFFFNDPATTEIYTLSLHDALPIYVTMYKDLLTVEELESFQSLLRTTTFISCILNLVVGYFFYKYTRLDDEALLRSEEHTSELQSRENLVCRLLLEKKKKKNTSKEK